MVNDYLALCCVYDSYHLYIYSLITIRPVTLSGARGLDTYGQQDQGHINENENLHGPLIMLGMPEMTTLSYKLYLLGDIQNIETE